MAQAEKGSSALEELVEGFAALLDLAAGAFTRGKVLGLLGLPAISRKLGMRETDTWASWCQRLGIVRGWDQKDLGDCYFSEDLLSWDQGIRRMALGAFMDPSEGPFEAEGQRYAPMDLGASLFEDAGLFVDTLDRLHRDLQGLAAGEHLPLAAWARRFSSLAGRWLGGDEDADRGALAKVQATLGKLAFLEPEGLGGADYPYGVAAELARQFLERLRVQGLSLRPDGVVVGTYASLRGMPFPVVFLPGLGEGRFPSKSAPDDLDLRMAPGRREPGDILAYERDRYFFLEALLGAREKVILSYLGHHAVTGEELAVSPVLGDLLEAIKPMLPGIKPRTCGLVRQHTLRRWDPDRFRKGGWGHLQRPVVRAEAGLAALREVRRQTEAPGEWIPVIHLPEPKAQDEVRTVTLRQIERFLKAPMQGAAAAVLGLREVRDDGSGLAAEPVSTAFLDARGLRREAFLAFRRTQGAGLQDCYLDVRARLAGEARTALGVLGSLEVGRDLPALMAWDEALAKDARLTRTRFGSGTQELDARVDDIRPEITYRFGFPGRKLEVRVGGLTGAWADFGGSGPLVLEDGDGENLDVPRTMKLLLGPWVDHLARQAQAFQAALEAPAPAALVPVHVLLAGGDPPYLRLQLPAVEPAEAYAILGRILKDFWGEVHEHPLPVDWTAGLSYPKYVAKASGDWSGEFGSRNSCSYGPLSRPDARGPAPEPVFTQARNRLEPLLTHVHGGQP
jgi:exodeoxyribonuclease V gamma subunit